MNEILENPRKISPTDESWRSLSPEERFLALQKVAEANKTARQRATVALKPAEKTPHKAA